METQAIHYSIEVASRRTAAAEATFSISHHSRTLTPLTNAKIVFSVTGISRFLLIPDKQRRRASWLHRQATSGCRPLVTEGQSPSMDLGMHFE
jgi:hypothetical protein